MRTYTHTHHSHIFTHTRIHTLIHVHTHTYFHTHTTHTLTNVQTYTRIYTHTHIYAHTLCILWISLSLSFPVSRLWISLMKNACKWRGPKYFALLLLLCFLQTSPLFYLDFSSFSIPSNGLFVPFKTSVKTEPEISVTFWETVEVKRWFSKKSNV